MLRNRDRFQILLGNRSRCFQEIAKYLACYWPNSDSRLIIGYNELLASKQEIKLMKLVVIFFVRTKALNIFKANMKESKIIRLGRENFWN